MQSPIAVAAGSIVSNQPVAGSPLSPFAIAPTASIAANSSESERDALPLQWASLPASPMRWTSLPTSPTRVNIPGAALLAPPPLPEKWQSLPASPQHPVPAPEEQSWLLGWASIVPSPLRIVHPEATIQCLEQAIRLPTAPDLLTGNVTDLATDVEATIVSSLVAAQEDEECERPDCDSDDSDHEEDEYEPEQPGGGVRYSQEFSECEDCESVHGSVPGTDGSHNGDPDDEDDSDGDPDDGDGTCDSNNADDSEEAMCESAPEPDGGPSVPSVRHGKRSSQEELRRVHEAAVLSSFSDFKCKSGCALAKSLGVPCCLDALSKVELRSVYNEVYKCRTPAAAGSSDTGQDASTNNVSRNVLELMWALRVPVPVGNGRPGQVTPPSRPHTNQSH